MKSCRRENESVQSRYRLLMISLGDFVQGSHWQLERTSLSTLITEVSKVSYFFSPVSSTHPAHGVCLLASPHERPHWGGWGGGGRQEERGWCGCGRGLLTSCLEEISTSMSCIFMPLFTDKWKYATSTSWVIISYWCQECMEYLCLTFCYLRRSGNENICSFWQIWGRGRSVIKDCLE